MGIKVSITGIQETDKMLGQLEPKLQKKVLRQTLRMGAKELLPSAKELVPVRTGNLRSSMKVRSGKRSKNRISMRVAGGDAGRGPGWYGFLINYGTKFILPRKYLQKAADQNRQRVQDKMRSDIVTNIKKAVK